MKQNIGKQHHRHISVKPVKNLPQRVGPGISFQVSPDLFSDLQSRAVTTQDSPDLPGRRLAGQPGGAEGGPAQWRPGAQAHSDPGQDEETVLTSREGRGNIDKVRLRKSSELVASSHLHVLPTST